MEQNIEHLVTKIKAIPDKLVAIEASWDGDDGGWGVVLIAVTLQENSQYNDEYVSFMRYEYGDYGEIMQPASAQFQRTKESQDAMLIGLSFP